MIVCIGCIAFVSCGVQKPDVDVLAASFSNLECRAYILREQRYALADRIRFSEDSIAAIKENSEQKTRLQNNLSGYMKAKDMILANSLRLADTIRLQLDTIIQIKLHSKDRIDAFNKALSLQLNKKNCQ